ncbi:TPA: hypothetical protein ACOBUB_002148 [Enterococcus faecium]
MNYDELIGTLYELARQTKDEELQSGLLDLGWTVKKSGIRDEGEDPNEDIHFKELLRRLARLTDQAKGLVDKNAIDDLRNTLASNGIDGYFGKFY